MHQLLLGGIRSGKTALAESRARYVAEADGGRVIYVATAQAGDEEMAQRIRRHQQQRPSDWGLVEEPIELAGVILRAPGGSCLLIDCMSLWVSNLLHAGDEVFNDQRAAFLRAVESCASDLLIVSNEVGLGTIGMDPLTRRFCDELGWLNQALAQRCQHVQLCVAGLSVTLKNEDSC